MTTKSITPGQKKQIVRFMEDALNRVELTRESAQQLIEKGDEFQSRIVTGIRELSVLNHQFTDEEVSSSYEYPKGYACFKPIYHQIKIIHELFPDISWGYYRPNENEIPIPLEAEGLCAIPRWEKFAPTYGEAVEKVLAMIALKWKFYNDRDGQLGAEYLRQHAKTVKMFQKLGDEQRDYDILVVPAQFGLRHRGRSVRRACEAFAANEFGLGAFAVGIMLLTHPEREVQWEQLHIDCAGDEFAPGANGGFSVAPVFRFFSNRLEFRAGWFGHFSAYYGSASAFVSQ